MGKIVNALDYITHNGPNAFVRECYYRLSDNYYEKYFNVSTGGMESKEKLELDDPDSHEYATVFYKHIFDALNKLPVDKAKSTLLDYGCGKGRFLIASASYRYEKIIGIELSHLIDKARNNLSEMKNRNTHKVELKQCNAMDFQVPLEVNIIYFFNPFRGAVLDRVIKNIRASHEYAPRKIYIIYFNNDHFDKLIAGQDWVTKTRHSELHSKISFGLYEIDNRSN
jgi:SAM-dependent methyltransferase